MEFLRKILVILFFIVLTASCTRKVDPGRIHIPVPTKIKTNSSQQKAGALASGVAVLEFAVLNIRGGGAPTFVRRMEVDTDDGITEDDILTFTIEDPPEGNDKLIQFMGVYEDESSGSLVFYYGDQNININGGEINLNLPANVFGGSTGKEGHVSGRMLSSQGPDTGPTGKLTLSFQPPDGKPAMEVIDFEIWDGWFSIFAIDSPTTGFTYTLKETGEVLFDSVNLNSSHFNPASGSTHHAKFNKPQSFQSDDGSLEAVTEADAAVGFFAKPGASGISFSGYNVCYHTDQVSIARSFTNSAGTSPLQWKPSGGTVGTDITASEGVAQTFETFATQSSCDPTSGTAIPVYPQKMDRGDSRAFGMDGPFRELNPFGSFGQYANLSYDGSSLTMSWSYLPGVLSNSAVSGAEIYAKFQTGGGGGGGGGDDTDCREQALEEGFTLVGTSTTENFVFNGSGHPAGPVTSGNRFNWRLQACPFRNTSVGKVYAERSAHTSCIGTCNEIEHLGWAPTGTTNISGTTFVTDTSWKGGQTRISGVNLSDPRFAVVSYSAGSTNFASNIVAGDEILFSVTSQRNSSSCGSFNNEDYQAGQFFTARLLKHDTSAKELYFIKGSAIDGVTASGAVMTSLANVSDGSDFCYIQAAKVPHFNDLNVSANVAASSLAMSANTTGGGLLLFRSNGTVDLQTGANFVASNRGFKGGDGPSGDIHGGGSNSGFSNTAPTGSGGEGSTNGGSDGPAGGGGFGTGGDGLNTSGGSGNFSGGGPSDVRIFLGGGGGAINPGPHDGGIGGGAIFTAIHQLQLSGNVTFDSGAEAGITRGGGGGGGTINILAKELNHGTHTLTLTALGGNGTGADAGGGGGGYVNQLTCSTTIGTGSSVVQNTGGTGVGSGLSGANGNDGTSGSPNPLRVDSDTGLCRD